MTTDLSKAKDENSRLKNRIDDLEYENAQLLDMIDRLTSSKMDLIRSTSQEMERLRRFIQLLSNALHGQGFNAKHISEIEAFIDIKSNNNNSKNNRSNYRNNKSSFKNNRSKFGSQNNPKSSNKWKNRNNYKSENEEKQASSVDNIITKLQSLNKNNKTANLKSLTPRTSNDKDNPSHRHTTSLASERGGLDLATRVNNPLSDLTVINENTNKKNSNTPLAMTGTIPKTRTPLNSITATANDESAGKSLKERMAMLKNKTETSQDNRISQIKQERGLNKVKVSTNKGDIAKLFDKRIESQKLGSLPSIGGGNNTISGNDGKKVKLTEVLKEDAKEMEPETVNLVLESLGLFAQETVIGSQSKNKIKKSKKINPNNDDDDIDDDLEEPIPGEDDEKEDEIKPPTALNFNNNGMMSKMSDKEKGNFEDIICKSFEENKSLKQVQMCNANIKDAFFIKILDTLEHLFESENNQIKSGLMDESQKSQITELWFDSNRIDNKGFTRLGEFIRKDSRITSIKVYNNKITTITTQVLNALVDAMGDNTTLQKFAYDGLRFQQQKDKKEKYLRRNADIARKARNAARKAAGN